MFNLKKINQGQYLLPQEQGMRVPGLIIASSHQINDPEINKPLEQVKNVAHLPGIIGHSIAMPDIHWGYGFPIGGVAATDAQTGVISPGGVGYDINCGVRLALVPEQMSQLSLKQKKDLLNTIYQNVPSGVGRGDRAKSLTTKDYHRIVHLGSQWSIEHGFGFAEDLEYSESKGFIEGADLKVISQQAQDRGKDQLGSIGSGNHFVEIGEVQQILLPEVAKAWNVSPGQIYILIHSGSRGFGHQICQDTLNLFIKQGFAEGLPDRQLVSAPIQSSYGQNYFKAMAAAANYAFNNRQQILHAVRQSFQQSLNISPPQIQMIYDVCHNIAKFENYEINGQIKKLCVHRKGATRAFGPHHPELNPLFQTTGQPVIVPGDMGRASYLMVGQGSLLTWCSSCHGAGRAQSRVQSAKKWQGQDPIRYMQSQGVLVKANSHKTITEEMPDAYKNVDDVVQTVQLAGLAKIVARLKPHLVVKG